VTFTGVIVANGKGKMIYLSQKQKDILTTNGFVTLCPKCKDKAPKSTGNTKEEHEVIAKLSDQ